MFSYIFVLETCYDYMVFSADDFQNLIRPVVDGFMTVDELVARIANLFVFISGVIAFFYLIYVGILYITAGDSPDKAKRAQRGLINVIIGVIIIMISYVLIRTVGNVVITVIK